MALTLLELASRAGEREDVESAWSARLTPSVATTSDFTFQGGRKKAMMRGVEVEYCEDLIVRKEEGWEVKAPKARDEEKVVAKLRLKVAAGLTLTEFVSTVRTVLERGIRRDGEDMVEFDGEKDNPLRERGETDEEALLLRLLRKGAANVGRKLLVALVNCTVEVQFWKGLKALLERGLVASVSHPDLMQNLVEHRRADCITLCFYYVLDLTPSDLMMALQFFLEKSNASRNAYEVVRQQWRTVATAAVDYAIEKKETFAKREAEIEKHLREQHVAVKQYAALKQRRYSTDIVAVDEDDFVLPRQELERRLLVTSTNSGAMSHAVVMALAVDGFEGWEICLHALIASGQDEAILAAIIRELETSEAVRLLQYLRKWLDRYSNRLSSNPAPKSRAKHPVHNVPSSQQVLQWVSMVLDGQYTRCVLSSEFLPELRAIQKSVDTVVAFGRKLVPMRGMVEHLREKHPLPSRRQDSAAHSDYTIEYLDIS